MRNEAEIGKNYAEARLLLNGEDYAKAEELVARTPPRGEGAVLYHAFGVMHASHKEWQEAITNFTMEIQLAPSNHNAYHFLAPLLAQVGDLEGYHRLRGVILRQFAGESDPMIAERMTKDCLLLPPPASDFPAIQKLADTAAAAGPDHPLWFYFQFAKGLSEYRQGRFASATNWLGKAAANTKVLHAPYVGAEVFLVLAMAHHQLDQFWPARGALSYGCWIAAAWPALGNNANDWIMTQMLMREARALIETTGHDEIAAKAFDALVGQYDFRIGVDVVTREGNHLFAQLLGKEPRIELFPQSETEFFIQGQSEQLAFVKDNTGKVVKAALRRGNTTLDAPRMEEMVEATVDPATYDALVGKYSLHSGRIMTVTRDENRLFAQMDYGTRNAGGTNAEPLLEIFPKSELQFFWKELNAQVTFVKDQKGFVRKAIYYQSGEPVEVTKIAALSQASYDALVGKYDFGEAGIMTITREENQLFTQLPGQPKGEILPASETEFFAKDVDAQTTFSKNEEGQVTRAILHQGGRNLEAPKLEDMVEAKVNAATYDALVGKYDYGHGITMTVTREEDHLFAQLTRQPKMEILPKSETEFFWKEVNAQVTFVKDEKGRVTKAVHHQGGETFEAPRIE